MSVTGTTILSIPHVHAQKGEYVRTGQDVYIWSFVLTVVQECEKPNPDVQRKQKLLEIALEWPFEFRPPISKKAAFFQAYQGCEDNEKIAMLEGNPPMMIGMRIEALEALLKDEARKPADVNQKTLLLEFQEQEKQ